MAKKSFSFNRGRVTFSNTSRQINKKTGEVFDKTNSFSFNLIGIVLAFLLLASVFMAVKGVQNEKTFEGFLNMLTTMPQIPLDFITKGLVFEVMPNVPILGDLLTFLWQTIVFVGFLVSGFINALLFILNFAFYFVV